MSNLRRLENPTGEDWSTIGARIRLQVFDECDVADLSPTLRQLCAVADTCERLAKATAAWVIPDRLRSKDDALRIAAEFEAALADYETEIIGAPTAPDGAEEG